MELNAATAEDFIQNTCIGTAGVIDLKHCSFAEVSGMIRLVLLVRHLTSQERTIQILIPDDEGVQGYLERANVFNQLNGFCTFDQSIEHLHLRGRYPTKKLVEVRSLEDVKQIRTIIDCFSAGLDEKGINGDISSTIVKVLFETLQNIPDHADPENTLGTYHGMAALQRYSSRLCLSIGDIGVGILHSLTSSPKFPRERFDHADAIMAAISGKSRHSDIGRGGGLKSVVAAVLKLGGHLTVRSGDAAVLITSDNNLQIAKYALFPGTQIDINVPLVGQN